MKIFSSPTYSKISTLAPSNVPTIIPPFIQAFIFPVPDASIPAVEIYSDKSVPGNIISAELTL